MKIKQKLGWLFLLALSSLPLIIWIAIKSPSERFGNFYLISTSLGQVSGLAGMAMFSLNLILGARLKFLEDYFGGLNRVYVAHSILGSLSFVFLLFHPLFLAARYLNISLPSAALFLLPGTDWAMNFGIIALLGMIMLMVLTLFLKLLYQNWKISHKFFGLVFFFAGLHSFFVTSDISRSPALKIYMLALAAAGMIAAVWRSIMKKYWVKKTKYVVRKTTRLGEGMVEIEMLAKNNTLDFKPGQFVFVSFYSPEVSSETHPFSISSPPGDKNLRIAVKALGDYTSGLQNINLGAMAEVEGPFGKFFYSNPEKKSQIWIAGGIGVTPFLSMARSFKTLKPDYKIDLYYSVSKERELVFLPELEKIEAENKNILVIPFCSETLKRRIDAKFIDRISGGLAGKDIYICGPPPMMASLKKQFLSLKMPKGDIHSEEFNLI